MIKTPERVEVHKAFRKYLREDGKTGLLLDNMIKAAEDFLPELLKVHGRPDFECLYDDIFTIQELVSFSASLKNDSELFAIRNGYICLAAIEAYIKFFATSRGLEIPEPPTAEVVPPDSNDLNWNFVEGGQADVHGVRYERDRDARMKCIEHYKCKCYVCGFDFEKAFGELGRGFIEVHHINPIAERSNIEGEYRVDPIVDLRPLCPNCHAMIHRNGIKSIEDLQSIRNNNYNI